MEQTKPNLTSDQAIEVQGVRSFPKFLGLGLVILVVALGILSGYLLTGHNKVSLLPGGSGVVSQSKINKGSEFGLKDTATFKDTAMGILEAGGLEGEGTHKLVRDGGPSQTVYLNSSVLDLDQFVGRKVQIWGETNRAQKAGWLMDVGKIKILE